jgi:hypothetical protein
MRYNDDADGVIRLTKQSCRNLFSRTERVRVSQIPIQSQGRFTTRYNDDADGVIRLTKRSRRNLFSQGKGSGSCKSPFKIRVDLQPRKSAGDRGQTIILSESFAGTTTR